MLKMKMQRVQCGLTQQEVANRLGIDRTTYTKYETGKSEPSFDALQKIAELLQIPVTELLQEWKEDASIKPVKPSSLAADPNYVEYRPTGTVPILGRIAAGVPISAIEEVEGYEPVTVSDPENCYYLRVEGDSMTGAGIQSGDLVLIRQQPTADNGQIVACKVNGDEATLKRFRQQDETVLLMPENPNYEPIVVPAKDFDTGYAQIFGVAIEVKRKL